MKFIGFYVTKNCYKQDTRVCLLVKKKLCYNTCTIKMSYFMKSSKLK